MVIFTKEECEFIKSFYNPSEEINASDLQDFKTVKLRFSKNRHSVKYTFPNDEILKSFLVSKLAPFKVKKIPSVKLMVYKQGDFLPEHQDFSKYGVDIMFKTIISQLSDSNEYTGGDLIVEGKAVDRSLGHTLAISPTDLHEIKKVESGERWSLVLFLKEENFHIQKSIL